MSGASVRARLEALEHQAGLSELPPPMLIDVPQDMPTPRFNTAAEKLAETFPEALCVTIFKFFPAWRFKTELPAAPPPKAKKWEVLHFEMERALKEDVEAWLATDEFREQLTEEARDTALRYSSGSWPRESLREVVNACKRHGVAVPKAAREALKRRTVLPPVATIPPSGPAARATVEVQPTGPALPPKATPPIPAPSGVLCTSCSCAAERHEAWREARDWPCVFCGYIAEAHMRPPYTDGGTQPCGSFRAYGCAGADGCECGRCAGLALPAVPERAPQMTFVLGRNRAPERLEDGP